MFKNILNFNRQKKAQDFIIYIQEIKNSKNLLKLQIKISKSDISKVQEELIKNQINKLVKIYPLNYIREFRLYLKMQKIPFITKFPFQEHEGHMVVVYDPYNNSENYYENLKGERKELIEEMYDWKLYDGNAKKREIKPVLKIVK